MCVCVCVCVGGWGVGDLGGFWLGVGGGGDLEEEKIMLAICIL